MENKMSKKTLNNETKRERFIRLAERRINVILEQFRKLGNLSNSRNYEYDDGDIDKMFAALNKALRSTRALYNRKSGTKSASFKF